MTRTSSDRRGWSSGAYAGLAVLPVPVLLSAGFFLSKDAVVAVTLAAMAWCVVFSFLYWFRLDETSKEAHKFGWLWGGSTGLLLAMVSLMSVALIPALNDLVIRTAGDELVLRGLVGGIIFTALVQVAGYGVVWAAWWIKARR